jgi:hypothetical protein
MADIVAGVRIHNIQTYTPNTYTQHAHTHKTYGTPQASQAQAASLSALICLLESLRGHPETYSHLEEPLEAVLRGIFGPEAASASDEHSNDGLEIINYLTYCAPKISPRMWGMFKPLCTRWMRVGYEDMDNINSVIDNYIRRCFQQCTITWSCILTDLVQVIWVPAASHVVMLKSF